MKNWWIVLIVVLIIGGLIYWYVRNRNKVVVVTPTNFDIPDINPGADGGGLVDTMLQ